jgi:hypothetical protein
MKLRVYRSPTLSAPELGSDRRSSKPGVPRSSRGGRAILARFQRFRPCWQIRAIFPVLQRLRLQMGSHRPTSQSVCELRREPTASGTRDDDGRRVQSSTRPSGCSRRMAAGCPCRRCPPNSMCTSGRYERPRRMEGLKQHRVRSPFREPDGHCVAFELATLHCSSIRFITCGTSSAKSSRSFTSASSTCRAAARYASRDE